MMNNVTAAVLAVIAATGAWFSADARAASDDRPNIVLIVADDHGTDAIGAYGNPVIKTPHLDALAKSGMRFNHAYASSSSCSPSRAVLLTGQHNHANGMYGLQHGVHHFQAFDHAPSLSVALSEAGYVTARIGKYHLAPEAVFAFDRVLSRGAANDMKSIARSPVEMARIAEAFIAETDEPFFLYFASDDPHRGFPFETAPAPNRFGNRDDGYPGVKQVKYDPSDVLVPPFLPDTPETRLELAEYYQSVSRLDQGVGALIEALKRRGEYDNTLIIYLSDNGIAFPAAKTTVYDPGVRLPLIVKAPHSDHRDAVSEAMISWVDIAPTALDYARAPQESVPAHGRSFRSVLEGTSTVDAWREVFASHSLHEIQMYYPMRMVRTDRYKLIWNIAHPLDFPFAKDLKFALTWLGFDGKLDALFGKRKVGAFVNRPEFELYDMIDDPHEINNLAGDREYEDVLADLKHRLRNFQKETGDKWEQKWEFE